MSRRDHHRVQERMIIYITWVASDPTLEHVVDCLFQGPLGVQGGRGEWEEHLGRVNHLAIQRKVSGDALARFRRLATHCDPSSWIDPEQADQ
jgi:hypothetical protein